MNLPKMKVRLRYAGFTCGCQQLLCSAGPRHFNLLKNLHFPSWHSNCNQWRQDATGLQFCGEGEFMSYNLVAKDWRELSEAASKELDPQKLMDLVTQLNEVLKQREDRKRDVSNFEPPQQ